MVQSLEEWPARLEAAAGQGALDGAWAAAVAAVAAADGADGADPAAVAAIARAAGLRVWALARERAAAGDRSSGHYDAIYRMRAEVARAGAGGAAGALAALDADFDRAARGAASIAWARTAPPELPALRGAPIRRVLLTGFDPYTGSSEAPSGWNPSGAAVLQLAGSQLAAGAELVAFEGAIFPVSFLQFDAGIVERLVRAEAATADAILTVSMDPALSGAAGDPVRLEQYAVGVRACVPLTPHPARGLEPLPTAVVRIPDSPGTRPGPPVIDAAARAGGPPTDLAGIAADAGATVGRELGLRFASEADRDRALAALAGAAHPGPGPLMLRVADPAAAALCEGLGGALVRGPGGAFLSNEIAYRPQRELSSAGSDATSFHIHVTNESTDLSQLVARLREIILRTILRRQAAGSARSGDRAAAP